MSTKTLRKRIALVAVVTLGAGLLSVVPANAAATLEAAEVVETAAGTTVNTTGVCAAGTPGASGAASTMNTAATPNVMQVGGTQQFTLSGSNADEGVMTITGPANWAATGIPATATFSLDASQKIISLEDIDATVKPVLTVTGVGAITVSVLASAGTAVLETFYITAVAECASSVSAANSFVQVTTSATNVDTLTQWATRQSAFNSTGAATTTVDALNTSNDVRTLFENSGVAYIAVRARDAYTSVFTGPSTLIISCDNGAKVNSTSLGFYSLTTFDGVSDSGTNVAVRQATAGVPMTTTCAVSVNGVALATKKISFAGDLATLTIASSRNGNVETGTEGRISYVAKDSAGNTLTQTVPTMTSGIGGAVTNVLTEWSDADFYTTSAAYVSAIGAGSNPAYKTSGYAKFNCLDYGTASITAYVYNTAGAKITSNAVDARCGGAIDTWTASLDKATYQAGDIATLTITAKDAAGGATAYGSTPGAGYSVAMPGMTAVVAPATTDTESSARTGVWTYTYTVNSVEGKYNGAIKISVASTSAQYGKAATVAYTISPNGSVSNADVLKAIVSLIASINKQIAALQKALLKK